MYNKNTKCWESGQYEEAILHWCSEAFNKDSPQALFIQADVLLPNASKGKHTADAVYLMERSAKLGYAQAALAMGQMFQYGWAVHRSSKTALSWYEKAAELGSHEATEILNQLRKLKKRRIIAATTAVCASVCTVLVIALILPSLLPVNGILVSEDTTLLQPTTQEEFVQALSDLIQQYDTELVVSGQQNTNRLLLKFEGTGIDLSSFPAATVIADEENYMVIQFTSEEEAQKCLSALREMAGVLFVDEDSYTSTIEDSIPSDAFNVSNVPYSSPYSGVVYYSWGAEFMGLDRLAAWLMTQQTTPVTVAVLDSGTEPCSENQHRILDGIDILNPSAGNGWTDMVGHGTHVAGTIIDCTWGLDVSILPVRIGNETIANSAIIEGLRYAIANSVDVINMSLGGPCTECDEQGVCGSVYYYYIQEAISNGIVVVVSAGNGDDYGNPIDTVDQCPAHIEECIVVGACDSNGWMGSFSNYGASVDVCAPGVDVISYVPGDTFDYMSGTSMAAPHISALAAMMKLYLPDKTPAQIEKYISDYSYAMGDSSYYGEGIPWASYFAGE